MERVVQLSPHEAAQSYARSVPRTIRRDSGQVYTPESMVEFTLDLGGYRPEEPLEEKAFLDPACGPGAFVVGAVGRVASRLGTLGEDPRGAAGFERLLATVEERVFAVDKDPHACALAREAVRYQIRAVSGREAPQGFFAGNVVVDDFLLGRLEALQGRRFHVIAGNPPYVATTRLSDQEKDALRERFIAANGRLDLYTLFFERGLRLLEKGGRLAFITPNKFLLSRSSRQLRKLILSTSSVRTIANFRSHRVFEDAATVPCVTVLERGPSATTFELMECAISPGGQGPVAVQTRQSVSHPTSGEQPWFLAEPGLLSLAEEIQDAHPPLGSLASRISAGIATGRDQIFVLPKEAARELEPELRRRAVRGQDVLAHQIKDPGLELILPYLPTKGRPTLVDLEDFPKTKAYLEEHREELLSRHCVRTWEKAWYDIHDPWTLDITELPKVIVPDVAAWNRFALDRGSFCPLHSAYYIIPDGVEPLYLAAVLNSQPIEFLVRLLAPVVKDGFSRYRRQFLVGLPIPEASPRAQAEIAAAVEAGDHATADQLCCELFRLSAKELTAMSEFLKRVQTVHGTGETVPA